MSGIGNNESDVGDDWEVKNGPGVSSNEDEDGDSEVMGVDGSEEDEFEVALKELLDSEEGELEASRDVVFKGGK